MPYGLPDMRVNFLKDLFGFEEPKKPARRKAAAKPKVRVSTREAEIRKVAKKKLDEGNGLTNFARSFRSSVGNTLGIAPRAAAGILSLASGRPYDEVFREVQAQEADTRSRSLTGNVLGMLYGGGGTGAIASGAIRAGGAKIGGKVGQAAINATRLERGKKFTNAAKLAVGGGIGGAAQAAGEGSDIGTGATIGTIAGPVVPVLGKAALRIVSLPMNAIGGSTAIKGALRRMTSTTAEELEQRALVRRQETGAEPTVFELLDAADQKRILEDVVGPNANVGDDAARMIAQRLQETGDIARNRVAAITQPRMQQAEQEIAGRIGQARGAPAEGDAAFAAQAVRSPEAMERLRSVEAGEIMRPFDDQIAVGSVDDLVPVVPVNKGGKIAQEPDPEIASVIRSVSGTARLRQGGGISVKEITDIRRSLKSLAARGDINSGPARAALDHIDEVMATRMPDAAAAIARSDEAFAGASRMAEGMQVGAQTTVRDAPGSVGTSDPQSQMVRNVFDTPEGGTGRAIGQTNRLLEMFTGGAGETSRAVRKIRSDSTIQKAIADNIGAQEGGDIVKAAQSLDDGIRALTKAMPKAEGAGAGGLEDIDMLVDAAVIGHPASFPTAKMWALRRIANATSMPEKMARDISEMLFSRDPVQTKRALNMLNSVMEDSKSFRRDLGLALVIGQEANALQGAGGEAVPAQSQNAPDPAAEPDFSQMSDEDLDAYIEQQQSAEPDFSQMSDEELDAYIEQQQSGGSGDYGQELQDLYDNSDPAFLDLLDRVEQQESGGNHQARSSAGAIGLMQVMPGTAPEAARLAGVPYDESAYYNDPSYQRLIGAAYLQEMLRKFDGNVALALAAYNAGPARVEKALASGGDWYSQLPAETQNYVRVLL